jgi:hypothetical protein
LVISSFSRISNSVNTQKYYFANLGANGSQIQQKYYFWIKICYPPALLIIFSLLQQEVYRDLGRFIALTCPPFHRLTHQILQKSQFAKVATTNVFSDFLIHVCLQWKKWVVLYFIQIIISPLELTLMSSSWFDYFPNNSKIDSATLQSTQWIITAAYNQCSLQSTPLFTVWLAVL